MSKAREQPNETTLTKNPHATDRIPDPIAYIPQRWRIGRSLGCAQVGTPICRFQAALVGALRPDPQVNVKWVLCVSDYALDRVARYAVTGRCAPFTHRCKAQNSVTRHRWDHDRRLLARHLLDVPEGEICFDSDATKLDKILVYVDSDWAGCKTTQASTSGGAIT